MLKLSLVVPDATVNYILNPNCRYDTTGYSAVSSTLTRSLDFSRFGIASCKVVTNGTVLNEGLFYRVNALAGISDPITVSAYVIGTGMVRIRLIDNPTGKQWSSQNVTLRADRYMRLSVSGVITGSNDVRLYVETNEGSAKARTFYVGGLQMERKAYATTFCDGDQPGCRWNGLYHGSTSQRAGDTRAGGRWVVISGDERQEQDLYMTVVGGLGMADIKNNIQSYALDPGGYFQNKKIVERLTTLTFHAKHTDLADNNAEKITSLNALHQLRQLMVDVVKPDRTGGDEEIIFEYDDGELPVYFKARYDGGLEGSWDIRNQWVNSFPLRLLSVSPLLYEDQQIANAIDFQNSVQVKHVLGRVNGLWNNLNSGFNSPPYASAIGPKGEIYMAGVFNVVNNVSTAIAPQIPAVVAYYDGEKWVAIATSYAGGTPQINVIAVAPNGDVYVGGDFTTIHGVAANRIAKWTSATATWSALGTGLNTGAVNAIAIAPNGDLYVGGSFATAGGVASAAIARWDGFQWRRVGQYGGLNNQVQTIAVTQDGATLYVGGTFSDQNGLVASALLMVTQYNISTGLFSAMGSGLTGTQLNKIIIADSGIVYAGGTFTASGTTTLSNIAQWNGGAWSTVGTGLDNQVRSLDFFSNGNIIAGGDFGNSGNVPVVRFAIYNGSTWVNMDNFFGTSFVISTTVFTCIVNRKFDDLYLGGTFNQNPGVYRDVLVSGITTVNNPGSVEASPLIYILGPGNLRWIENQTTKKRMYLNMPILSNEEIFIDIGKGTIISTVRGNVFYAMLPGSDFRSMKLRPGDNTIAALMTNDVNAKMQIYFTPQHWSADATQNVESL